jgi:hypothetical protein
MLVTTFTGSFLSRLTIVVGCNLGWVLPLSRLTRGVGCNLVWVLPVQVDQRCWLYGTETIRLKAVPEVAVQNRFISYSRVKQNIWFSSVRRSLAPFHKYWPSKITRETFVIVRKKNKVKFRNLKFIEITDCILDVFYTMSTTVVCCAVYK